MIIFVDIDDVLNEFTKNFIIYYNNRFNTNFKYEDFFTYPYGEVLGITYKEDVNIVFEFCKSDLFSNLKPIEHSQKVINELNKNNKLYLITGRPKELEKETIDWVNKYFNRKFQDFFLTNYHHGNRKSKKSDIILKKKGNVCIDDDLEHINDFIESEVNFLLYNRPWNIKFNTDKRVYNWNEVLKKV